MRDNGAPCVREGRHGGAHRTAGGSPWATFELDEEPDEAARVLLLTPWELEAVRACAEVGMEGAPEEITAACEAVLERIADEKALTAARAAIAFDRMGERMASAAKPEPEGGE